MSRRSSSTLAFAFAFAFVVFAAVATTMHARGISAAAAAAPDGKTIFTSKCAACHQANGAGGGPYPPLAANADLTSADTSGVIAIVLNGRSGPIQVNGKTFSGAMPAWKD